MKQEHFCYLYKTMCNNQKERGKLNTNGPCAKTIHLVVHSVLGASLYMMMIMFILGLGQHNNCALILACSMDNFFGCYQSKSIVFSHQTPYHI